MRKFTGLLVKKSLGCYLNLLSYARPEKASLLAYRLFSEPRDGRLLKDRLPQVLRDTDTETYRHDGHDIQFYTWKGNRQIILLVHGWESNAARWEQLLPYLKASGSTVVAVDAPAHGLSSGTEFNVPRYAEFIDAAIRRFKPDALIGHSIGGAACLYHQHLYPHHAVAKMVLLGAPSDLQTLVDNFGKMLGLNARMLDLLEQYFSDRFKIRTSEFSGRIFGSTLRAQGMIAHDIEDDVVSFAEARKIAGSWKSATFIETRGLGHSMHDVALYEKVSAFLAHP